MGTKDASVPMECSIMKTLPFVIDFTLVIMVLLMKCLVQILWFSMWQSGPAKEKSRLDPKDYFKLILYFRIHMTASFSLLASLVEIQTNLVALKVKYLMQRH